MSREAAWCVLEIFRYAIVLNRLIHCLFERICDFGTTVLQGYLTRIDSETRTKLRPKTLSKISQGSNLKSKANSVQSSDFKSCNKQLDSSRQKTKRKSFEKVEYPQHFSSLAEGSEIAVTGVSVTVPHTVVCELSKAKKIILSYEFIKDSSVETHIRSHEISYRRSDDSAKYLSIHSDPSSEEPQKPVGTSFQDPEKHDDISSGVARKYVVPSAVEPQKQIKSSSRKHEKHIGTPAEESEKHTDQSIENQERLLLFQSQKSLNPTVVTPEQAKIVAPPRSLVTDKTYYSVVEHTDQATELMKKYGNSKETGKRSLAHAGEKPIDPMLCLLELSKSFFDPGMLDTAIPDNDHAQAATGALVEAEIEAAKENTAVGGKEQIDSETEDEETE